MHDFKFKKNHASQNLKFSRRRGGESEKPLYPILCKIDFRYDPNISIPEPADGSV